MYQLGVRWKIAQLRGLLGDDRDELAGAGRVADHRDPLAGKLDAVIPLSGVERRTLEFFDAGRYRAAWGG